MEPQLTKSPQKERKIDDLIRYIRNNHEGRPNFSLLLGSGCSCTSGIRSGEELVKIWKDEIIQKESQYEEEKSTDAYFKQCTWYDEEYAYSKLFEKLYDLPIQRKEFIEGEIVGKIPSLGYAYLVKLVECGAFNTIFTTNFDDLINEAFYKYGNVEHRPIVCAHDSSIMSITPLSKRPKIIKLHGDYLFDNIKSIDNETKNLGENMQLKVEEFARITGLIVVGYSGCDDSVMDVLLNKIEDDKFYQHGIYWCIRKGDKISKKLVTLIEKNRCYLIYIDGFDELMCELGKKLDDISPIEYLTDENPSNTIKNIIENEKLKNTNSKFLKAALTDLTNKYIKLSKQDELNTQENNQEDEQFNIDNPKEKDLNINDRTVVERLQKKIELEEYDSANSEILKLLERSVDKIFSNQLQVLLGEIYYKQERFHEAQKLIDSLIANDPYGKYNYLNLIACTKLQSQKLEIINRALTYCPYDSKLYFSKAQILRKLDIERLSYIQTNKNPEILKVLLEGEKYFKSVDSDCWQYYFDYNLNFAQYANASTSECEKILEYYNQIFPKHYEVIRRKTQLLCLNKEEFKNISDYINQNRFEGNEKENLQYDLLKLKCAYELSDRSMVKELMQKFDTIHASSQDYAILKAEIKYSLFRNIEEASSVLSTYLTDNEKTSYRVRKELINYLLAQGKLDLAKKYISSSERENELQKLFKTEILECQNLWEDILKDTIEKEEIEGKTASSLIQKTHALLMLEQFNEVHDLLHDKIIENSMLSPILIINCELADVKLRQKKDRNLKKRPRIEQIANSDCGDRDQRAAALIILNQVQKAKELILEDLRDDFSNEQIYRKCYVFTRFKGDLVSELIQEVKIEVESF
ncbi:SIR2 family protein [uncultured Sphaerochaeta sp.]|uniref:SIR2 family protein n=1 Tax=uncultured Sphaerochaeta sp. TaxID=886478 RepID=UPI002AA7351D|nr:SIR2 family protein [uncultured Sphaerochaeta sp.]